MTPCVDFYQGGSTRGPSGGLSRGGQSSRDPFLILGAGEEGPLDPRLVGRPSGVTPDIPVFNSDFTYLWSRGITLRVSYPK